VGAAAPGELPGESLGLVGPTTWLSARWWNDLAVPKLVEEELICMMGLCQCQ